MPLLGSYAATSIVIASTIILVVVIRLFFRKALESTKRWPYQRQLLVFRMTGMSSLLGEIPKGRSCRRTR